MEGRLQQDECDKLNELAKQSRGHIIEIGSLYGKSTVCLSSGIPRGFKVYAIDPHYENSYEKFMHNISSSPFRDRIIPVKKTSEEAFSELKNIRSGMVWIDGCHDFEYVLFDFEHWKKTLVHDGIMAFHDFVITHPGVVKTVMKACSEMKFIGWCNNIIYFTHGKTGIPARIKLFLYAFRSMKQNFSFFYINLKRFKKNLI